MSAKAWRNRRRRARRDAAIRANAMRVSGWFTLVAQYGMRMTVAQLHGERAHWPVTSGQSWRIP